jgi:nucleotide-binding universal stress UspA family protein
MFEHVLVPLDGSSLAECVLPSVIAICRLFNSQVTLLHVLERPQVLSDTQTIDPLEWHVLKTEAIQYLETIANRLERVGVGAQTVVREGRAAESIINYTIQNGMSLLILSTHGEGGLDEWNIGSTVQKVMLRARQSILLIRATQPTPLIDAIQHQKILVPLDGSTRAENVLPVANILSNFHNTELVLIQVVHKPEMPRHVPLSPEETMLVEKITELNYQESTRYLEQLEIQFAPGIKTYSLISQNPTTALHNLVQQEEIDLVLFNAHGFSGEAQHPYGSVVTQFIVYGTTSLLIMQDFPVESINQSRMDIASGPAF